MLRYLNTFLILFATLLVLMASDNLEDIRLFVATILLLFCAAISFARAT